MKYLLRTTLLAIMLLVAYSCSKPHPDEDQKDYLISYSHIGEHDKDDIAQIIAQKTGYDILKEYGSLIPDITLSFDKIVYKSIDGGICSALLVTPKDKAPKETILAMHYTIGKLEEAPTESFLSPELLSAFLGHCVIVPDYIGFGESSSMTHTYLHIESTAKDAICALKACREYLSSVKKINLGKDINIAGYSEGGGNAMAVQKVAEREGQESIIIKKVFCGGGLYDMSGTLSYFVKNNIAEYPFGIAMAALGIDAGDRLNLDFSKIFIGNLALNYKEWILSKKYYTYEVNELIGSSTLSDFFHPDFFNGKGNTEITKLYRSAEQNTLTQGWTPKAPIVLIHGTDDLIVPYLNAENAYNTFKAKGCSIELISVPEASHEEAMFAYLLQFYLNLAK